MLHSAYSCLHYRNLLQELDLAEDTSSSSQTDELGSATTNDTSSFRSIPPLDVYVEVLLAFGFLLAGQLVAMGSLQPVEVASRNSSSSSSYRPLSAPAYKTRDFDIYEHRGKGISTKVKKI